MRLRAKSRGWGRGTRRGAGSGGALVVAVLLAALAALWLLTVLVRALIAAFSTPYPWIVLAVAGVGTAAYKLYQRVARERVEARFWVAVAAVGDRSADAAAAVERMLGSSKPNADMLLVAAAEAAASGRDAVALGRIEWAKAHASSVGSLSGGLRLQFPGLAGALAFGPGSHSATMLDIVRSHLLIRVGRASEVLALPAPAPNDPLLPLRLSVLGDAQMATGHFDAAAQAFREAAGRFRGTPEGDDIGYRLARALESAGWLGEAAKVYQSLGEFGDAPSRASQVSRAYETAQADARTKAAELEHRTRAQEAARALEKARAEQEARHAEAERRQRVIERAEDQALQGAIDKLRAARGAAGRRAAVERALDAIASPARREQLLSEASRLEVLAVLEKVDGLKTAAAKRRHLTAALDALRNDEVRDDLQTAQIRWLEQALVELDT